MPTSPDQLTEIATRHQFFVERYKAGEVKKFEKFLLEMAGVVRVKIGDKNLSEFTRARLDKLNAEINKALTDIYSGYGVTWRDGVIDFAKYESQFEIKSLKEVVDFDFALPSASQLDAAVFGNPMAVQGTYNGFFLGDTIADLSQKTITRVNGAINAGSARGLTTPEIVRSIIGTKKAGYADGVLSMSYKDANLLVRTGLQHTASMARQRTWEQNADIIKGWRFRAVFDSRTTAQCRAIDQEDKIYPVGKGPLPPLHINCVSGDANILSRGAISNVYERRYKGAIVNVRTKSGRSLTITPNHPVLTALGWKAAGELNSADKLACIDEAGLIVSNKKDSVKAKAADLFAALNVSADPSFVANRPATAKDFHGDFSDSNIGVININSESWNRFRKVFGQYGVYGFFVFGFFVDFSLLGKGGFNKAFMRMLASSCGIMSRASKVCDLLRSGCSHSCKLLLASISFFSAAISKYSLYYGWGKSKILGNSRNSFAAIKGGNDAFDAGLDPCIGEVFYGQNGNSKPFYSPVNNVHADSEIAAQLFDGGAGLVHFDDIVEYFVSEFDGHVYNLSNDDNWYLCSGIITHNCRSTSVAALDDRFSFLSEDATRSARGEDGVESVSANLGYYDWMKTQPAAFQDAALGETRAKLFREGGLSADRYAEISVGKLKEPLNLEQMKELDVTAFSKAGL